MTDFVMPSSSFSAAEIATIYDELSFWSSRFGQLLFNHLPLQKDLDILDVGCGTGFPLFELAHLYGESCRVTGVDIWEEALGKAKTKLAIYGLPNVSIIKADGAALPFEGEKFDLLVSNLGVNNFADPARAMSECFRVTRPGGRIALATNVKGHMQEFYDVFKEVLARVGKGAYLSQLEVHEAHRGTRESHCATLEAVGFRVSKVVEETFQMRYLDGRALLNHSLTRLGFLGGWRTIVKPEDELEVFAELERRLNRLAEHKGELAMTIPMLYIEGKKAKTQHERNSYER